MRYKPYLKYKDSGVEWLGEIPEGWNAKRIGYHFTDRREKVSDKDYPALSVSMQGIVPQMEHVAKTEDNDNRKLTRIGDLVINSRSDRKGASGLSQYDGSVSLINTVLIPDQGIYGWFAHHLIRSTAFQEEFYRYGKGIVADLWSTNFSEMKDISIPIPSLTTQRAIAAFLDTETERIDGLIKDYEDLIALLKEKRQALISHAVTRGLSELVSPDDPEFGEWAKPVKFKDSGVEWIGEIPEEWDIWRVAHAFITSSGTTPPVGEEKWYGGTIPWITTGELREGIILETDKCVTEEALKQFSALKLVPPDSLLIAMYGATIGRLARNAVPATTNQACCALSPKSNAITTFAFFYFQVAKDYLVLLSSGGGQPNISQEKIRSFSIPLPPLPTQQAIALFLERSTTKIDTLVSESESAIELLKEHRSALITNAVTGKINVEAST